jgi:hypothetical protein
VLKNRTVAADTFLLNTLAKTVRFITLEVTDRSLLSDLNFSVQQMDDHYIASSGVFRYAKPIMQFDSAGYFVKQLLQLGDGPIELPGISSWFINDSLKKITANSGPKVVTYSFQENKWQTILLKNYIVNAILLNDGNYVANTTVYGTGEVDIPYLQFFNSKGEIIKSQNYPQERDIYFEIPEGGYNGPLEAYGLYQSYSNDALFHDVFNDTIYRIKDMHTIEPYICLQRNKLMPDVRDMNDRRKKAKAMFFRNISETKNYFLVKYNYNDAIYNAILSKSSGEMIANTGSNYEDKNIITVNYPHFAKYRTPQGNDILVGITRVTSDRFYCTVRHSDAMEFIPGVNDESNPVMMIVELQD